MIGQFIIIAEDTQGRIIKAFSWSGSLQEGFNRARQACAQRGYFAPQLFADRIANQ